MPDSTRIALSVLWTVVATAGPTASPAVPARAAIAGERADLATARQLVAAGRVKEAAEWLDRRVAAVPDDADALILLGTARALLAQPSASLAALRRAVELRPEQAAGHYALCMALARFGEIAGARSSCEAAVEADPGLAGAQIALGTMLASEDDLQGAEQHFTAALASGADVETRAQASYLRGRLRRQQGRSSQAIQDLATAVRLSPKLAPAYLELGRARVDAADDEGAIEALRRSVQLDPESFDGHYDLGTQYLRTGDAARAVPELRVAAAQRPDDRDVVYSLGRALRAIGSKQEADELLKGLSRESRGRATGDAEVREAGRLNNEGIELEARGDYEEALARYRAAVEIQPQDPLFRKNLGLALCRLGRWDEAKAELREVLRASPGEPDAQKALYQALEHAPDPDPGGAR